MTKRNPTKFYVSQDVLKMWLGIDDGEWSTIESDGGAIGPNGSHVTIRKREHEGWDQRGYWSPSSYEVLISGYHSQLNEVGIPMDEYRDACALQGLGPSWLETPID